MPRTARIYIKEGVFHILTRGNNCLRIYEDSGDYTYYLNILKTYKSQHKFQLYHYCLMPNHVHLIIDPGLETDLSKLMKQVNLAYLHYYKKKYGYSGHFWQDRFKSLLISKDEYLIACGRYIELNPVKAHIVKDPKDYKWSSYNVYAYGTKDNITDINPIYKEWGNTEKERQANYRKGIKEEIKNANLNFNAKFMGTQKFIKAMEDKFKTKNLRLKRGRPRITNK